MIRRKRVSLSTVVEGHTVGRNRQGRNRVQTLMSRREERNAEMKRLAEDRLIYGEETAK